VSDSIARAVGLAVAGPGRDILVIPLLESEGGDG
jgi:hypothetical protein